MCPHPSISISPTPENSWGVADTYDARCTQCAQTVLANASADEIYQFLREGTRRIAAGSQYLPPDKPESQRLPFDTLAIAATVNPSSEKEKTD